MGIFDWLWGRKKTKSQDRGQTLGSPSGPQACSVCGTALPDHFRLGAVVTGSGWGFCKTCNQLFCPACSKREESRGIGLVLFKCPKCSKQLDNPTTVPAPPRPAKLPHADQMKLQFELVLAISGLRGDGDPYCPASGSVDAITAWKTDEVKRLLDAGADANGCVGYNDTPLEVAAKEGVADIVQLLLSRGADASPALDIAVQNGHKEVVAALLAAGAAANHSRDGNTPLHTAVRSAYHDDSVAIAELLLKHGADPNMRDTKGETALEMARRLSTDPPRTKDYAFEGRWRRALSSMINFLDQRR